MDVFFKITNLYAEVLKNFALWMFILDHYNYTPCTSAPVAI